ncbi:MAG: hypothetical protein M1835_007579 [Candelina submexicana]|nr:MAG: hypothetical protein M1835_007579 [Candelina submexicana]
MLIINRVLVAVVISWSALVQGASNNNASFVNRTTCNGKTYTYEQLAGYGFLPGNARDKFGDTIGGIGSDIALDRSAWKKTGPSSYQGVVWALPDRGWNTQGTLNYQPRVHKLQVSLTLKPDATVTKPSGPNVQLTYLDTILFSGPDGTPTTGLDADASGFLSYPGFPELPVATFVGDGFGGSGPGGKRISIDAEGLVLNSDGSFWVSDEYGPYVYRFDPRGKMVAAIRPSEAYIPRRNGTESFSANSPPYYNRNKTVTPPNGATGRQNNQGFEGLTVTGDGNNLYILTQSALNQEGNLASVNSGRRNARLLKYDVSTNKPRYAKEFVVQLPLWTDPTAKDSKNPKVAAQSSIFHVQNGQFFVLARDSGAGHGQSSSTSIYRHADIFDIGPATDIKSTANDAATGAIASSEGVLNPGITPATYCSFIDFNINTQLNRFGAHNGGPQDQNQLNEKWESLGIVPVDGLIGDDDEWFLFSFSDNDFITQDGHLNGGRFSYSDVSGYNLDNQVLVFQIKLPDHSRPFNRNNGN